MSQFNLLTLQTPKIKKAGAFGCLNAVLYLQPGGWRCTAASKGCLRACLNTAGRGAFPNTQAARKRRTRLLDSNPQEFDRLLYGELDAFLRLAERRKLKPVVRLNGTSDLDWSLTYKEYPEIQFVEYTKRIEVVRDYVEDWLPSNLCLNFSRSETNEAECVEALKLGVNVCVVFDTPTGKPLPSKMNFGDGKVWTVIDGDLHDLRHLDLRPAIVGLRAKGKAKKDRSGFVVKVEDYL